MKEIFSITPFTMSDYPDKLSAIIWFRGCNMRCLYCYNDDIVLKNGNIAKDEFINFLDSKIFKLEAIVFSGGECSINPWFLELAQEVKKRNFLLKVDTNGSNPKILKKAINSNLIDYISLDFKALEADFKDITKSNLYSNFIETLSYLINIKFDFEVRTTVHSDLLNEKDISAMANLIHSYGYKKPYYLQKYMQTSKNLKEPNKDFDPKLINSPLKIILRNF